MLRIPTPGPAGASPGAVTLKDLDVTRPLFCKVMPLLLKDTYGNTVKFLVMSTACFQVAVTTTKCIYREKHEHNCGKVFLITPITAKTIWKQSGKTHRLRFQNALQRYNNQNRIALANWRGIDCYVSRMRLQNKPSAYSHLIFIEGPENIQGGRI